QETALLFDDQDGIETARELGCEARLDREGAGELGETDPERGETVDADAEIVERLNQIVVRLAGSGDADARAVAGAVHAVERVGVEELPKSPDAALMRFDVEFIRDRHRKPRIGALDVAGGRGEAMPV